VSSKKPTRKPSASVEEVRATHVVRGQSRETVIGWGLLALTFFYVGWVVVSPLRHMHSAPVFFLESRFLGQFPQRPGGLLECVARLVVQAESNRWLGAAVYTALVGLTGWSVSRLLRSTGKSLGLLAYGPSLILVALLGRYEASVLETGGGGLLMLGSLSAWQAGASLPPRLRLGIFWAIAGLLFYVAGSWPLIVFALAGGLTEIARCQPRRGLLCWLAVVLLPIGWLLFPEANSAASVDRWGQGWALGLTIAFWVLLAAGLPITIAWLRITRRGSSANAAGRSRSTRFCQTKASDEPGWMAAACFTIAAILLILSFDGRQKALIQIQLAADQQRWDTVLSRAAGLADYPAATRLQVHRALWQTGQLCDQLFTFPQRRDVDLLPTLRNGLDVCLPLSDVLLELGHVNLAERYAHEALEILGERPAVLRRLALVNVLKDRPQAARVFLNHLANVPGQREWARRQLRALDADSQLSGDKFIAHLRAVQVKVLHSETQFSTRTILEWATQASPQNRMAFEFLLTHYLLTGQGEEILRSLPRLRELGFAELPRHVEEAILAVTRGQNDQVYERSGLRLRPESVARFARYVDAASHAVDMAALAGEFGDTYWFYSQFGRTCATSP